MNNLWFWDVSPRFWHWHHWVIFILFVILCFAIVLFGCGIESIVELVF